MVGNSALDIFVTPGRKDFAIVAQVDDAIKQAVKEHDPAPLIAYGNKIRSVVQLGAVAVCKIANALKEHWKEFEGVQDETWDEYTHAELGLDATTARNYARVWRHIFGNPDLREEVKTDLAGWHISSLVDISAAAERGELEGKWDEILACSNRSEVREKLREIRGEEIASSNGMKLFLFKDGSLKLKVGQGRYLGFGFLNLEDKNENVVKAVSRIKDAAGILEVG
jgi:hypothetical protein